VTDSLAWSERVRMESGAQNKFLQRTKLFPLYYKTMSERFT